MFIISALYIFMQYIYEYRCINLNELSSDACFYHILEGYFIRFAVIFPKADFKIFDIGHFSLSIFAVCPLTCNDGPVFPFCLMRNDLSVFSNKFPSVLCGPRDPQLYVGDTVRLVFHCLILFPIVCLT